MTLQLRPTFSESWYRVADLRARLRATAQISRQFYRGERWYVVRDPAGNQFHRLSDAAYRFVALLDGSRTVAEAWELVGGQLADDAPTQPEVIQILSQLYAANLIEANITPDASVLLRRHKQMIKRQFQGRLMNLLFPRIPLWDPDAFVKRWMPLIHVVLSPLGAVLWLAVFGGALYMLTAKGWGNLFSEASKATDPGNWMFLWFTFVLVKFIHECGHAFACRRFGGEIHEMGVMFLVFIPTPYVDASSAWAFPSRWHRMFVGAAGMIFELFIASIMAFVWSNTQSGVPLAGIPVHELAYNTMLIASVTTVLFNANPLLRYDGYYMLSDYLEIPNLQQRSTEYVMGLIKRHVFRIKARQPLPPPMARFWLLIYGICSSIYRVFVGIMIILFVTYKVPILGVLMALGGVATWIVMPAVKLLKYLTIDPELHRKRGRAWAFSGAVAAALIIVIGIIPVPVRFRADGISEYAVQQEVYARTAGFVRQIVVHDGQSVRQGDPLVLLSNPELEAQVAVLRHTLSELQVQRQQAMYENDSTAIQVADAQISANQQKLDDGQRRLDDLTIRAPVSGRVIAPYLEYLPGRFIPERAQVATVAATDRIVVYAVLKQDDFELARRAGADLDPQVRMVGAAAEVLDRQTPALHGGLHRVCGIDLIEGAQPRLRHPSQSWMGGGNVAVDPRDRSGTKPLVEQFEIKLTLDNTGQPFLPGQRAILRFKPFSKPLAWQWANSFLRLIQTQNLGGRMGTPPGMTPSG